MNEELKGTTIDDGIIYIGERDLTRQLVYVIRNYRFNNNNQEPKAIVLPDIKEIGGVKIEFPKEQAIESTRAKPSKTGDTDSGEPSQE